MTEQAIEAMEIAALEVDPFRAFQVWLADAARLEPNDPNAMTLATSTADGRPSARIVLLKGVESDGAAPQGFVFYTNKLSRKGGELAENRHAALLFHWKSMRRQVRIEGHVEDVTDAAADRYFSSRARVSRLGAIASEQSRPLLERGVLERRVAELEVRYPGPDIPRPAYWSGYIVVPERFEFWQEMPHRLHDRSVFTPDGSGGWSREKLFP